MSGVFFIKFERSGNMEKIDEARRKINEIDKEMADLFCQRMEQARIVAEYKAERGLKVYDPVRENEVIDRNSKNVPAGIIREYYVSFLRNNMDISKKYQHRLMEGMNIAYSGVEGAFADIAVKKIFPDAKQTPYSEFSKAYKAVENGECDCCVLPIENSYAGEVGQVIDLIFDGSLYVNNIYSLKITQNLLGIKGSTKSDIKEVMSHPQALAQCENYIKENGYLMTNSVNTAVAAKTVKENGDKTVAAIASRETAEIYGLEVIDHDINESDVNATKFAVLSRMENPAFNSSKVILLFSVKQVAGSLAKAIDVIGKYGYNMKVLRSRPMKEPAWQYYFYIEAECNDNCDNESEMLEELSKQCERLKVVGHYKDVYSL